MSHVDGANKESEGFVWVHWSEYTKHILQDLLMNLGRVRSTAQ